MHERSLARTLIRQVDEELRLRGLHRLTEVRLQIGEFTGVEPKLLESAFEELASSHWDGFVRLNCEIVRLTARCRACRTEFFVNRFRFECPSCNGRQVDVIAGEELKLISLRAESISQLTDTAS